MDNRPIGFLDSGVGGLTVVRELLRQLPHEDVVYIGDSARAPYGPRPADQIREYTWQMVNFLLTKNVKMIVLACNTATAVVWEEVKEKLDIPVLGVILPGASAAIKSTTHQKIGVIGTPMTVSSGIYKEKIQSLAPDMEVSSLACPKFVPLVESNELASSVTKKVVYETLKPLVGKVDTLVLGCTHWAIYQSWGSLYSNSLSLINLRAPHSLNVLAIFRQSLQSYWHLQWYKSGGSALRVRDSY